MTLWHENDREAESWSPAEETLRLIASLPAPEGLVDRVQASLRNDSRSTRVLRWPVWIAGEGFLYGSALRGAAAAVIVCVVAGGGWQIYSHVQVAPSAQSVPAAVPARIGNGFSSAGAMRTPDSPNGPVLMHTPATQVKVQVPAAKHAKKHKKASPGAVPQP